MNIVRNTNSGVMIHILVAFARIHCKMEMVLVINAQGAKYECESSSDTGPRLYLIRPPYLC